MASSAPPASDLKRELGLFDAVMINAGTMIASAIFLVPATVAAAVQGTAVMTLVWVIGGVVWLLGGPLVAELAGPHPPAGRPDAELRGSLWSGWALLVRLVDLFPLPIGARTPHCPGFAT